MWCQKCPTNFANFKVNELQVLKEKRQKQRDVHNLEERMLLDKLADTEQKIHSRPIRHPRKTRPSHRLPLPRSKDVKVLQQEVILSHSAKMYSSLLF